MAYCFIYSGGDSLLICKHKQVFSVFHAVAHFALHRETQTLKDGGIITNCTYIVVRRKAIMVYL